MKNPRWWVTERGLVFDKCDSFGESRGSPCITTWTASVGLLLVWFRKRSVGGVVQAGGSLPPSQRFHVARATSWQHGSHMNMVSTKDLSGNSGIDSDGVEVPQVFEDRGVGMLDIPFYEASPLRYWLTLLAIAVLGVLGTAGYLMIG
jgi:hypothetical protein